MNKIQRTISISPFSFFFFFFFLLFQVKHVYNTCYMKNSLIFSTLWMPLHENVVLVTPSLYISLSTGTYRAYEQDHSHQLKHFSWYKKGYKKANWKKGMKKAHVSQIKLRLTLISLREWNGLKPQCHFLQQWNPTPGFLLHARTQEKDNKYHKFGPTSEPCTSCMSTMLHQIKKLTSSWCYCSSWRIIECTESNARTSMSGGRAYPAEDIWTQYLKYINFMFMQSMCKIKTRSTCIL